MDSSEVASLEGRLRRWRDDNLAALQDRDLLNTLTNMRQTGENMVDLANMKDMTQLYRMSRVSDEAVKMYFEALRNPQLRNVLSNISPAWSYFFESTDKGIPNTFFADTLEKALGISTVIPEFDEFGTRKVVPTEEDAAVLRDGIVRGDLTIDEESRLRATMEQIRTAVGDSRPLSAFTSSWDAYSLVQKSPELQGAIANTFRTNVQSLVTRVNEGRINLDIFTIREGDTSRNQASFGSGISIDVDQNKIRQLIDDVMVDQGVTQLQAQGIVQNTARTERAELLNLYRLADLYPNIQVGGKSLRQYLNDELGEARTSSPKTPFLTTPPAAFRALQERYPPRPLEERVPSVPEPTEQEVEINRLTGLITRPRTILEEFPELRSSNREEEIQNVRRKRQELIEERTRLESGISDVGLTEEEMAAEPPARLNAEQIAQQYWDAKGKGASAKELGDLLESMGIDKDTIDRTLRMFRRGGEGE
jgi:hypothetical protein